MNRSLALFLPLALAAAPAAAQHPADAAVITLVKDFLEAERSFDQPKLAALISPDYAEISPVGELDQRAAFLGFYAADKKQQAPAMRLGEMRIRHYGETASILTSLSFDRPGPDGQSRTASIRVGFLAVRSGGTWKLASAQYTPERPRPPAPAK